MNKNLRLYLLNWIFLSLFLNSCGSSSSQKNPAPLYVPGVNPNSTTQPSPNSTTPQNPPSNPSKNPQQSPFTKNYSFSGSRGIIPPLDTSKFNTENFSTDSILSVSLTANSTGTINANGHGFIPPYNCIRMDVSLYRSDTHTQIGNSRQAYINTNDDDYCNGHLVNKDLDFSDLLRSGSPTGYYIQLSNAFSDLYDSTRFSLTLLYQVYPTWLISGELSIMINQIN